MGTSEKKLVFRGYLIAKIACLFNDLVVICKLYRVH